jgi:hypothetical protein
MSERNEREERAFDALIVSHLLRDRDLTNLDDLPELTESERAAMNAVPEDLVENLWDGENERTPDEASKDDATECVTEDEEEFAAMNRGEQMDEETKQKLDLARKEVIELMRRQQRGREDADR